jgi:WD40 repeat protein
MSTTSLRLSVVALIALTAPAAFLGQESKVDCYGDPLPDGAIARLGTVRLRHSDLVILTAFLRDNKALLTVAADGTVCQWDVATSKELSRFKAIAVESGETPNLFGSPVTYASGATVSIRVEQHVLALSADCKILATGSMNGWIYLWDTATGKQFQSIRGDGEIVFAPDGKMAALRGNSGSVALFDVATGESVRQIGPKSKSQDQFFWRYGAGMAFSPDAKTLVMALQENKERGPVWYFILYDTTSGRELHRITIHEQMPGSPSFSPDGKTLFWLKSGGTIQRAEVATGKRMPELSREGATVYVVSPDRKTLIARNWDGTRVRTYDLVAGKVADEFERSVPPELWRRGIPNRPHAMGVATDGKLLALAGENHTVCLLNLESGKERYIGDGHRSAITYVRYSSDGKKILTEDEDQILSVWDPATGRKQTPIELPQGNRYWLLSSERCSLHTVADGSHQLRFWDTMTGKELARVPALQDRISSLALAPDRKTVAAHGASDSRVWIRLFDTTTGRELRLIELPKQSGDDAFSFPPMPVDAVRVCYSPDSRFVAALVNRHELGLWDVATGTKLPRIQAPDSRPILGAYFTPDGRCVALDLDDRALGQWEIATGKLRRYLGEKPLIADPERGWQRLELMGGNGGNGFGGGGSVPLPYSRPTAAAFAPGGRIMARSGTSGSINLWDIVTGNRVEQLKGHKGWVKSLAFSPDGKTLASGSRDTTVLIWDTTKYTASAKPQAATINVAARWGDLLGDDAAKAFDAVCALATAPDKAVAFLKDQVRPAAHSDAAAIQQLIADLDSEQFSVRTEATDELARLGETAVPFIRKALESNPSPEARKRLEALLAKEPWRVPTGETLRSLRAIEVLEMIGTPEAKAVLQTLAKGAAEARVTSAAQAALERLRR